MASGFAACSSSGSDASIASDAGSDATTGRDAGDGGSVTSDSGVSRSDATSTDDASTCKLTKPYATKDVACNDCAAANCCEAVNACYADTDCDDGYVNCILACVLLPDDAGPDAGDAGVATCTAACGTQYPKGKTEYDAIDACIASSCASACK